jgi:site-specific DNA-methyltransferase (adenine-specific)
MEIKDIVNTVICGDCLDVMKQLPDKCVDLVLTDPPYGLNKKIHDGGTWAVHEKYNAVLDWDFVPDKEYFDETMRISRNQIIWGGNYFTDILPKTRCWLAWVKPHFPTMSELDLAWTSFDEPSKVFHYPRVNPSTHPTQKPVALFEWCLEKYSKPGDTVLDCFAGSGTLAVASIRTKRNYIMIEKEPAYVDICKARIAQAETGVSVKEAKAGQGALWK